MGYRNPYGLTEIQRKFCEEYVRLYNGKQAYHIASGNPNLDTCRVAANKLLHKPEIQAYIKECQQAVVERAAISAEKIAFLLDEIATDRDESTSSRIRALDLLQKQYNLQKATVDAHIKDTIEINIVGDDNE